MDNFGNFKRYFSATTNYVGKTNLRRSFFASKIRRISFQIYENNFEEKEIIIAGVIGEGFALAKMLCDHIQEISKLQAKAVEIHLNKEIPYEKPVSFDCSLDLFENKVIVVVDDVLNTGRTFSYSLAPFLSIPVKKYKSRFWSTAITENFQFQLITRAMNYLLPYPNTWR